MTIENEPRDAESTKNLGSSDIPLVLEMEIEEDVPAELEHFLRLVMLGEDDLANEYFDRVLRRHVYIFPVFAEYADFLVQTRDVERLRDVLKDVQTNDFGATGKELVPLLKAYVELLLNPSEGKDRANAKVQAEQAIDCDSLGVFAHMGFLVTHETQPMQIRFFRTVCALNYEMQRQMRASGTFYRSLLDQGHLWEAFKLQRYHYNDQKEFLEFKDAARQCKNRDVAELSLLAVTNCYFTKLDIPPLQLTPIVESLRTCLEEQCSALELLVRVLDGYTGGKRLQQWISNSISLYHTVEEIYWRSFENVNGHDKAVFKHAALIEAAIRTRTVPGLEHRDVQYSIKALSDPGAYSKPSAEPHDDLAGTRLVILSVQLLHCLKKLRNYRDYAESTIPRAVKPTDRPLRSARRSGPLNSLQSSISPRLAGLSSFHRSAASSFLSSFAPDNEVTVSVDGEGQAVGEDYVLGKQIGFGGYSVIREAFTTAPPGRLAVKIVRRQIEGKTEAENKVIQDALTREIKIWSILRNRHILKLEVVYILDEATFCFMPLTSEMTLSDLVRANRQGIAADEVKRYSYQVASALSYLHLQVGVVHRDLTLDNCLLRLIESSGKPGPHYSVQLSNFGMAEWLLKNRDQSQSAGQYPQNSYRQVVKLTADFANKNLEYSAPEILRKFNESLVPEHITLQKIYTNPAMDIWSFGVCVYALFVGERPFQHPFQPRVTMAVTAGDWNRERLVSKAKDEAVECVKGCLDLDANKRWDISRILKSSWLEDIDSENEGD